MGILWRIIGMAGNYPIRLALAYITALLAIGFSLAIPVAVRQRHQSDGRAGPDNQGILQEGLHAIEPW